MQRALLKFREAWDRVRTKLIQLRELSSGRRGEKRLARETSERTEVPHGPIEPTATQDERLAPEVEAVEGASLDKGTTLDAVAEEDRLLNPNAFGGCSHGRHERRRASVECVRANFVRWPPRKSPAG